MPQERYNRPYEGQCRECMRRRRPCFYVSKLGGGSYRSAPRTISGMLCVECILDMLPNATRWPDGYSGAGRWSTPDVRLTAADLYVPTTESEAAAEARIAAAFIRA